MGVPVSPWIIRINAQMFPIGPRFLITSARSDEQHGQERWLTENGWVDAPEPLAKVATLERVRRAGLDYSAIRVFGQYHFSPVAWILVCEAIDIALYEPRLLTECLTADIMLPGDDDPRTRKP
jgi:hypothetical protein